MGHGAGLGQAQFDAEHQFLAFVAGFHFLGGELRLGGDKADLGRQRLLGQGVEQNPRFTANGQASGDGGWEVEVHVLIIGINQQQHASTRAKHFAGFGQAQLDDAVDGRTQAAVVDFTGELGDLGLGGTNGGLCRIDLGLGRDHGSVAGVLAGLLLVDQLAAGEAALVQLLGTPEFLLGQQLFALAQLHIGLGGREVLLGPQHFGFGLGALGFQGAGVHARQQLALEHLVAFIDPHFGQASGDLGGDLHFGGFQATIALAQAFGQAILGGAPVTEAAGAEQ